MHEGLAVPVRCVAGWNVAAEPNGRWGRAGAAIAARKDAWTSLARGGSRAADLFVIEVDDGGGFPHGDSSVAVSWLSRTRSRSGGPSTPSHR